jgi:hypothetical protein
VLGIGGPGQGDGEQADYGCGAESQVAEHDGLLKERHNRNVSTVRTIPCGHYSGLKSFSRANSRLPPVA